MIKGGLKMRYCRCKGIIKITMALLFMLCGITAIKANAASDFTYTDNADGTVSVTGYNGAVMDVVIPETLDNKKVTIIGERTFYGIDITSVNIPATVTSIGNSAFEYCVKLSKVTIADGGLTAIGSKAFSRCTALKTVSLPATVSSIGNQAFASMKEISFSTYAVGTKYGEKVFKDTKLTALKCRQSSTTYKYAASLTKNISYEGPYVDSLKQAVNVGSTITLELHQGVGETVWTSSDTSIATVENGVITGCKAGKATITATNSGEALDIEVTVNKLSLNYKSISVTKGYSVKLTLKGASGVTWTSGNKKIAKVDSKGKVTAKKEGKTTITANVMNAKYTCKVTVKKNEAQIYKYSTNAYNYSGGTLGFSKIEKTSKGYKVKAHFMNGTYKKIKSIKNMKITIKAGKKTIAQKYVKSIKLNLSGKRTKTITFNFKGSEVKKKVDLRTSGALNASTSGGKYYWEETRTITKTVPANQ